MLLIWELTNFGHKKIDDLQKMLKSEQELCNDFESHSPFSDLYLCDLGKRFLLGKHYPG